jgi:pantoate--beta-alanine ligase
MILFKKATDLHNYLEMERQKGGQVGFVPTMGALHAGHVSLVKTSIKENSLTLCSLFVNPAQFNDPRDFKKYPMMIEKDISMLEEIGCTVLFLPSVKEIYPHGTSTKKSYDLGYLEKVLEGKYRPGHFQGVCMVMQRLLEIVDRGRLYMGQKDYQQCLVVARLIGLMGRKDRIELVRCPTLREPDGLAMSSRNMRLNEEEHIKAATIYRSLLMIRDNMKKENLGELKGKAAEMLVENGFIIDYVEIARPKDLEPVDHWDGKEKLIALVAAFLGEVRLIDNMLLDY